MNERTKIIICIIVIGVAVTSSITILALTLPAPEQPKLIHISLVEGDQSTIQLHIFEGFFVYFKRDMPYSSDEQSIEIYFTEIRYVNGTEYLIESERTKFSHESLQLNNNTALIELLDHRILVELK